MNPSKHSSAADLHVRKLTLIAWIVRIDDEKTIREIEAIFKKRQLLKEKKLKA
jgi:hypothetical protein